jgi:hypothetical protein
VPQHGRRPWQPPLGVGEIKTVAVVELKTVAVAGIVGQENVAVAGIVELKTVAAVSIGGAKDAAVELNNLNPRAGTGHTGHEQGATHCEEQRADAVVSGQ